MPDEQIKPSWPKRHKQAVIGLSIVLLCFILVASVGLSSLGDGNNSRDLTNNARQIHNWCTRYCYIKTTLADDASQLAAAARKTDWAVVAADSQILEGDVTKAKALPAIPNANIAAHFSSASMLYQQAAQDYANGAHYAQDGAVDNDSSLINLATAELSAGTSLIKQGAVQLQDVSSSLIPSL